MPDPYAMQAFETLTYVPVKRRHRHSSWGLCRVQMHAAMPFVSRGPDRFNGLNECTVELFCSRSDSSKSQHSPE